MRKIIILSLVLILSTTVLYSQRRVRYGIQAGINISNIGKVPLFKNEGGEGFYVGFLTDIKLVAGLHIQPGLSLSTKSFTLKTPNFETATMGAKSLVNAYYLSLPIGITYKFRVAKGLRLFVTGEPSFSYGIAGTTVQSFKTLDDTGQPIMVSPEYKTFKNSSKENVGINNFDMGMFVGGGLEFKAIGIKGGYDFGLLNISETYKTKFNAAKILITVLF